MPTEDEVIDRLYGLALDEFTSERNEAARQLRTDGDRELAQRIKNLAKPTLPAWAINQVARSHSDLVRELIGVQEALASARSAQELRRHSSARRDLVRELLRHAEHTLTDAGHSAGSATMQQISRTLLAGATDEERESLERGRLTKELSSSGIEQAWGTADLAEAVEEDREEQDLGRARRRAEELTKTARELQREAERMSMEAEQARSHAERAQLKAERALERAASAENEASEARREAGLED